MHYINLLVNTIILSTLSICFICIFFFTYTKDVEKYIVTNNVKYLFNNLMPNFNMLPSKQLAILKEGVNNIKLPNLEEEDAKAIESNNELLSKTKIFLGSLFVLAMVFSYHMCKKHGLNFTELLSNNLILLICIALVEFIFLNYIAKKYISADPNMIIKNILKSF